MGMAQLHTNQPSCTNFQGQLRDKPRKPTFRKKKLSGSSGQKPQR